MGHGFVILSEENKNLYKDAEKIILNIKVKIYFNEREKRKVERRLGLEGGGVVGKFLLTPLKSMKVT